MYLYYHWIEIFVILGITLGISILLLILGIFLAIYNIDKFLSVSISSIVFGAIVTCILIITISITLLKSEQIGILVNKDDESEKIYNVLKLEHSSKKNEYFNLVNKEYLDIDIISFYKFTKIKYLKPITIYNNYFKN